ncbi:EamA family transporter [Candidatus Woesearchaeota archaeon]|nr:EamA family transporter [Candidatus Woesearchaeota archaeon]
MRFSAVLLVIACTLFLSIGQPLWKLASAKLPAVSVELLAGFILYGLGALFLVLALKQGELSVVFPFVATTYVWVALISAFYLGEQVSWLRWLGVAFITCAVIVIGSSEAPQ